MDFVVKKIHIEDESDISDDCRAILKKEIFPQLEEKLKGFGYEVLCVESNPEKLEK